ncbi:ABC1 kinase family protein [Calderihabitans maritimus]|uniref:ABC transporter n=1 Tax=Calderihabitans maritimus TaxID=1246530 RepID=A0A1Z5HQK9_9FIRM|nr:AarF/ABC1/UbiB kinase family protein [Calderihabitans maritimus]GAW91816.1 ABC transporter [Calderihabitans maritimus]
MQLRRRYRHFNRFREVANVLAKHGFSYLLDQTGLVEFLPRAQWKNMKEREETAKLSAPERMVLVLEELGPTFIKLGQILSTRADLLPESYTRALARLQDKVPPVEHSRVVKVIEEELGKPLETLFASFETEPLASASIGQVHLASLESGEKVVVKVQRPGIPQVIETDLDILFEVARWLEQRTSWGKFYQVMDIVEEFARSIRAELDFTQEGRNAERIAHNFADDPDVVIPRVYWELSSKKILVMEYVEGIKISNLDTLRHQGYDLKTVARRVVSAVLKQTFEDGFFHADPHPGNVAVLPGEKILFLDFGQVGRIDEWLRERFIDLIVAMARQDVGGVVRAVLHIGITNGRVDIRALRREVFRLKNKYYELPMSQINLGEAVGELLRISRQFRIRIPPEISLMAKALLTVEALVQRLDPQLSLMEVAEPFGKKLLRRRLSPREIGRRIWEQIMEFSGLLSELPERLEQLLDLLEEGNLTVNLEHQGLRAFMNHLNTVSNRICLSIVIGSVIIGSSLLAQKTASSFLARVPVAEIGFLVAVLMGFWLIISIVRSGRF